MTEATQEVQNTSFRDALREAYAQQQGPEGAPAADETTEAADADLAELADAVSEDGIDQESEDVTEPDEQGSTEAGDAGESQAFTAPQRWPQERQEAFDALTDEGKELLLDIHKDMEAGLTKGQTELAEQRKRYQQFDRFFDNLSNRIPNTDRNQLEAATMQSLPQILERYIALQQKPVETLIEIAEEMGAASALSEQLTELDLSDEATRELRRENLRLKRDSRERDLQATTQVSDQVSSQLDDFRTATNEDGSLKHPHYDEVSTTMGGLMQADPDLSLEDAYPIAVRAKLPEAMEAEARKKARKELIAEARKAKRRQTSGRSGPGVPQPSEEETPKTRREHLRAELAKQLAANE